MDGKILDIIGENFNTSRRIKATSPRVVKDGDMVKLNYVNLKGEKAFLDVTSLYPEDPSQLKKTQLVHVAQAMRNKDLAYIEWVILRQIEAGANIIDICVDEICVDEEERHEWMRWISAIVQKMADVTFAVDSSDPVTVTAGLEVYDCTKSRPAINSVNLEIGRDVLIPLAKKYDALLLANASGRDNIPTSKEERVDNLDQIMAMMDEEDIPMDHRYLDPLCFPVGAAADAPLHYLDACSELRAKYPEVHIFGGHSNTSFGMPQRKVLNSAFIIRSIIAGCDTLMIDPVMNEIKQFDDFKLANDVLMGTDMMGMDYITHFRP
jgi:5-methyltetrahydrofolate--homocysteine methyltransferase